MKQIEGIDFAFFNIHLDHVNFEAHMPCIEIALQQIKTILQNFPKTQYLFFGGCLYCEENDPVINKIKNDGFIEVPFENTFHDFSGEADRHWDYLFWKPYNKSNDIEMKFTYSLIDKKGSTIDKINQRYISDHFPAYAEFEIIEELSDKKDNQILKD